MASALYGAGAMGGVVNLLSRRPGDEPERELLFNQFDARRHGWGRVAVFPVVGFVGDDPRRRRPPPGSDRCPTATGGPTWPTMNAESCDRGSSGTTGRASRCSSRPARHARTAPAARSREACSRSRARRTGKPSRRAATTSGALWQVVAGRSVVTARATLARQWHDHQFGETLERDRHDTSFAEITLRRATGPHTWVGGVAVEQDAYRPADVPRYALYLHHAGPVRAG